MHTAPEVTALTTDTLPATEIKIGVRYLNLYYDSVHALKNVTLELGAREITALIGPSGCGKSSFLRCLNRMNDTIANAKASGEVWLDGVDIYKRGVDVVELASASACVFTVRLPIASPAMN